MTALAIPTDAGMIERAIIGGDLARLSSQERTAYYTRLCESLGLNPLTRPFEYITLSGKLTLYARRDCADQLRKIHDVSVRFTSREYWQDTSIWVVTAVATTASGRFDEASGGVDVGGLRGEALANALMKAETKAKRRVTLSICGLGWMDETEVADVAEARPVVMAPIKPDVEAMLRGSTSVAATEEILRTATKPGIRAHAYAALIRLAKDDQTLDEVVARSGADPVVPEEMARKILEQAKARREALANERMGRNVAAINGETRDPDNIAREEQAAGA